MAHALLAGVVTIFVVGPLAAWAIVHVGNRWHHDGRPNRHEAHHPANERLRERP